MGIGPDGAGLHSEGRRVPHGSSSWAGLLTKRPVPAGSRLGHSGADSLGLLEHFSRKIIPLFSFSKNKWKMSVGSHGERPFSFGRVSKK